MAPHSSTLAWKIPWTEEPGRLQCMGLRRVGHDWATSLSLFTFMHWRRKWRPSAVFLPGESQGRQSLVPGVIQSQTLLKRLSSSSSSKLDYKRDFRKYVVDACNGHLWARQPTLSWVVTAWDEKPYLGWNRKASLGHTV